MSVQLQKHYFSVDDYYRMADAGVFPRGVRIELIDGEVIEMCPIGNRHAGCVNRLGTLLNRKVADSTGRSRNQHLTTHEQAAFSKRMESSQSCNWKCRCLLERDVAG